MDNPNEYIEMINTRGAVVHVRRWEVSLCKEQGMRIIRNPKQTYYPEYDQELNPQAFFSDNSPENIEEENLLRVEEL